MKTAIVYATSHGTTEKVANMISESIENADTINLKQISTIDLNNYDQIIIGGSIHAGKIQRRVKMFCQKNLTQLLRMRVGLFVCAMNEPEFEKELNAAFPESISNHALSRKVVGGEFIIEKMNFIERFLIKKISGVTQTISKLDSKNISALVNEMKLVNN
ncbi:MAG: flavodoxin domain-containing protein [Bacteroidales bacterium]